MEKCPDHGRCSQPDDWVEEIVVDVSRRFAETPSGQWPGKVSAFDCIADHGLARRRRPNSHGVEGGR
jgi:hypothetical protein